MRYVTPGWCLVIFFNWSKVFKEYKLDKQLNIRLEEVIFNKQLLDWIQ